MGVARFLTMDEATKQGYEHNGDLFDPSMEGAAKAEERWYYLSFDHIEPKRRAIDAVVVPIHAAKEWGGALLAYAIATRGERKSKGCRNGSWEDGPYGRVE